MVKIQLDLPDRLNRFIGIQQEVYKLKGKRQTIIKILEEKLEKQKELMRLFPK